MSTTSCEGARELIADLVAGRLSGDRAEEVEDHVRGCAECAAEARLARLLFEARPVPDAAMAERVRRAVVAGRARSWLRRPAWALSAAAAVVVALGIGVVWQRDGGRQAPNVPVYVSDGYDESLWMADDALIAGGVSFDGLSDEELAELLDEMSSGSAGGAA